MLHTGGNYMITGLQGAHHGKIQSYSGIVRKDHPGRICTINQTCNRFPYRKQLPRGLQGAAVSPSAGGGPHLLHSLHDGSIDLFRLGKAGGGIIQVDGHGMIGHLTGPWQAVPLRTVQKGPTAPRHVGVPSG